MAGLGWRQRWGSQPQEFVKLKSLWGRERFGNSVARTGILGSQSGILDGYCCESDDGAVGRFPALLSIGCGW